MKIQMKSTKRYLSAILASAIIFSQALPALPVHADEPKLPSGIGYDEVGARIEEFVSEHEDTTAGMEISVFNKDGTIYKNYFGYADKEAGIAAAQDTVMEWGSATKMLVWVSVMQLWEQGLINLDADIREYLPEGFLTNLKYASPVTMLNLMNHNAGFQEVYADLFVKGLEDVRPFEEAIKAHMPEQIYEPGSVTAYSNWGVALAAYIVGRISGVSFCDYVHQNIFAPLGMESSALSADLGDNSRVMEKRKELQCYTAEGVLIPDCFYYITLYPAGMCTSTLDDFEKFGKALLDRETPLFRESETWELLFTPTAYLGDSEFPSNYHGFWVVPYEVETIGHGGNTVGCSSYLLLDVQNGAGAVVMTNQSGETVYNCDMMELFFGEFSEQDYFGELRAAPAGILRPARTVRKGPFKLISLSFTDEVDANQFWAHGTSGGVEKICFSYADYLCISVWEMVLELALIFMWAAALIFSVLSIIVKLIRKLIYICRKKPDVMHVELRSPGSTSKYSYGKNGSAIPLNGWSMLAALVQTAAAGLLAVVVTEALSYEAADSYIWASAALGAAAVIAVCMAVYGIIMLGKTKSTKKRKLYNWVTLVMLVFMVVNILYWNLFMFWKI